MRNPLRLATAVGVIAAVTAVTAGSAFAATTTTTTPRPRFSTASGTVASLSAASSSMEVQGTAGQVTVSWTTTTRFSQTVVESASQVVVGDCVTVSSSTKAKTGPITATTVSVRPSTKGSCTGAGGFGFATPPGGTGGFGGGFPGGGTFSGRPPGGTFPGSGAGARRFNGAGIGRFATGQVIAKAGSSFEVKGFAPTAPGPANATKTKGKTTSTTRPAAASRKTVDTKVTFNSKTKFTSTEQASFTNLAVGVCATALGPANDIGAITAATISISAASKSGCSFGAFGGFGGGGFGGGRFGGGFGGGT